MGGPGASTTTPHDVAGGVHPLPLPFRINRISALLLLSLLKCLVVVVAVKAEGRVLCIPGEREALLSIRRHLTDPSHRLSSWVDGDCCGWYGVVCHNSTGHVLHLHLSSAKFLYSTRFGGKVTPSLPRLTQLTHLDLSGNYFGGIPIPDFLGSLQNLRYLDLSDSGFGGRIPRQLGNLSALEHLDLGLNDGSESGSTSLEWISGLRSLQYLDLSWVNLSGASDWVLVTSALPSLQTLRLSRTGCPLHLNSPFLPTPLNFSSLSSLDLSFNYNSLFPQWIFRLPGLTSLALSDNHLEGPIPDSIGNLASLMVLRLGFNSLQGTIPESIRNLASLTSLDLTHNSLQGTIPDSVGNLASLAFLDLSSNSLRGTIPDSVGNLASLAFLDLSNNSLQGTIPDSVGNLASLAFLDLSSNSLRGTIPDSVGNLASLISVDLSNNSLQATIPESVGRLLSLEELDLSDNQLNGTFPKSLGQLINLRGLHTWSNPMEGDITEVHFQNLTKLVSLTSSGNGLSLKVSPKWVPPFQLQLLQIDSWQIGPEFPPWLRSQKDLISLRMSSAGIRSPLPHWFWHSFPNCFHFDLSHNQIYGELTNIPSIFPSGSMVILDSNNISGVLPPISGNITALDLSNNSLSGSLSHFLCHNPQRSKQMTYLNLQRNRLSGEIPNCWMSWRWLSILDLRMNQFTGHFPSSIAFLKLLHSLHLGNNHFQGELFAFLKNCTYLMVVDLANNNFTGSIPTWTGKKLSSMKILILRSNHFFGPIPQQLCALTSLQVLDMAHNNISGIIPGCFHNFTAMFISQNTRTTISVQLSMADVFRFREVSRATKVTAMILGLLSKPNTVVEEAFIVTKGQRLYYTLNLGLMSTIDLSNNNLFGKIPKELTHLAGLRSLNLSNNLLTGHIPETIGAMVMLESLDFSLNKLYGGIPPSMSTMTFLSSLNLSNNNLFGKIPSGTQLQGFDRSSFVGNRLCGPPLIESCSSSNASTEVEREQRIQKEENEVDGVFLSVVLGFVVGFWFVLTPLLYKKSWRVAYFKSLNSLWKLIYRDSSN